MVISSELRDLIYPPPDPCAPEEEEVSAGYELVAVECTGITSGGSEYELEAVPITELFPDQPMKGKQPLIDNVEPDPCELAFVSDLDEKDVWQTFSASIVPAISRKRD